MLHLGADVSKQELHPLTYIGPLREEEIPRYWSGDSEQCIFTPSWDLSSCLSGLPSQYFKVGALEVNAMLVAAAKQHINITPHSARHKMFGF